MRPPAIRSLWNLASPAPRAVPRGARRARAGLAAALCAAGLAPPLEAQSLAEVLEAIEQARNPVRVLCVTAHPDDEPGAVLAYLARGLHADVALLSLTRGEGGQNALGPEYGPPLGVLRTHELAEAARVYGTRVFFTRAPDFGYSKTAEETLRLWGDAVLDDMVRVIRTFRPHVVLNHWAGARGGHGHHQAAGILTPRAVEAAADPARFPAHRAAGLPAWKVAVLANVSRGDAARGLSLPLEEISPLWGKSWSAIGLEGFLHHRSQGIAGFRRSPLLRGTRMLTAAGGGDLSAGVLKADLVRLEDDFPQFSRLISAELHAASDALYLAASGRGAGTGLPGWDATVASLAEAALAVRRALSRLARWPEEQTAALRWELERAAERIERALALAAAVRLDAQAARPELVAGEAFHVTVTWQHRSGLPLEVTGVSLALPPGWSVARQEPLPAPGRGARFTVAIPAGAAPPRGPAEWMHPWPAALVRARLEVRASDYTFTAEEPVVAERVTSAGAEVLPLELIPAVTLSPEPRRIILRSGEPPRPREIVVRVRHNGAGAARVRVALEAPRGWHTGAPETLAFDGPGDALLRFTVTPPAQAQAGSYKLSLVARREGDAGEYRASLEPLASLPARLWSEPAEVAAHVFALEVPAGLKVGYVAAENETVPAALRQVGVEVTLLDEAALAFGDLAPFDAICIGLRAYELRRDLPRANARLLDYAARGGTLLVQYHRESAWNALLPAPYPARVGQPTLRTSAEDSPVRILAPEHPALRAPHLITAEDFAGWVQERGLYYWSEWDARYRPLLGLRDPGEEELSGALVYAPVGEGHYVYTGLTFFRQLPAGVPGAWRLLINLLSLSRTAR